jgi:starch-binding outer membrane protein, SusD/RagB family
MCRRTYIFVSFLLLMTLGAGSCRKTFDLLPENQLDVSQMYRNVNDADAAVIGLYGQFMGLAQQYVLLNELRADQLHASIQSDQYIRQISNHTVSDDNPYIKPRQWFQLILNCNDILKNFNIMRADNKMKEAEYLQRYADVAFLRSFLYLQLGIHYGRVPYVTHPLERVDDLKDASKFPQVPFNALLDSLIQFSEAIPYKDEYPAGTNLNITVDGYPTAKFFINKRFMLGDLHLWKGNYNQAAIYYRQVMETGTVGIVNGSYYSLYKLGWDNNGDIDHYIQYSRPGDATTLITRTQWRIMFEQAMNTEGFRREWVWALPFDNKFKPDNSLVELFSPIGGKYLVKPSQEAIDLWDNEQQRTNTSAPQIPGMPYDARGILSWQMIGGQPVAMKYLYNYIDFHTKLPFNALLKNGKWFLYRQTHLHLRFAEAANRVGQHKLAWAFFNNGLPAAYPSPSTDVTNFMNTLNLPYPYNFDARASPGASGPFYRADWYRNIGIRARANLINMPVTSPADSLIQIENGLLKEGALENAFEGTRWPDLMRMAMRRNDPAILADRVFEKLRKEGDPMAATTRAKLMNPANWYLPLKW